ncbi:hypothetical protein Hanom_Chr13g01233501 [Helianthus anomalus]
MVTALSPMIDEIWPLDMAKSSGVEELLMAVQRISECLRWLMVHSDGGDDGSWC